MKPARQARTLAAAALVAALGGAGASAQRPDAGWPSWRGPLRNGVAPAASPPVEWSEQRNVRWKVELPGRGSSTPIVWGDAIFLQAAIPTGASGANAQRLEDWQRDGSEVFDGQAYRPASEVQAYVVLALDRATGAERWRVEVARGLPHEGIHPTNTWASASPSTDGHRLVAFFGSRGLFCFDLDGELLWSKDLGDMDTRNGWGEGASPALVGDLVVVNWDHEGESFLAAFDLESGAERWRTPRDEPSSWFTPLPVRVGDRQQVLTIGANRVRGYDLASGELIWYGPGLTLNAIPTPLAHDGVAYLTSGYSGTVLLAVDLARASGSIEESAALLWRYDRDTPYVASPLALGGTLYLTKHLRGILSVLDARTGARRYGPVRLPGIRNLYASPVAGGGRVYVTGREGVTVVLAHDETASAPVVLATNPLDDGFDASAAIVGRELYLRGQRFLYRIEEDGSAPSGAQARESTMPAGGPRR